MNKSSKTTIKWDNLPQSACSSRNKTHGRIPTSSNDKVANKNTIGPSISAIRLEHSQEIPNCFSTLAPSHYKKSIRINEGRNKSDNGLGSKKASRNKQAEKTKILLKPQKQFNERVQEVTNIYNNSSLNIADFLNSSLNPKMNKTKKKK